LDHAMEEHLLLEERTLFPMLKGINPKTEQPALFAAAFSKCDPFREDLFPFVVAGMPGHWAGQYLFNVQRHLKSQAGGAAGAGSEGVGEAGGRNRDLDQEGKWQAGLLALGEQDGRVKVEKISSAIGWAPLFKKEVIAARALVRTTEAAKVEQADEQPSHTAASAVA